MAVSTKELGSILEIAKVEHVANRKAAMFRSMVQAPAVEDLVDEWQRTTDEHLDQLREILRTQ
jgi:hypothetical protein